MRYSPAHNVDSMERSTEKGKTPGKVGKGKMQGREGERGEAGVRWRWGKGEEKRGEGGDKNDYEWKCWEF